MKAAQAVGVLLLSSACARSTPPAGPLRIAVPYELATLDPHADDKLSSFAVLSNLYDPLVRTDADMGIVPGLAQSWESPDPLTWVFHLRPGVRFHSGKALRAADVVYSFQRLQRDPALQVRNYATEVAAVDADGEATVRIKTLFPTRILLNKLTYVNIVPDGADAALRTGVDGTGPYRLVTWKPGASLLLRRNEGYWNGVPAVADVQFDLARSPEEALDGLVRGDYRLIKADSRRADTLAQSGGRFATLRRDNLFVKYLAFDLGHDATPFCPGRPNPFRDPRVRRAIDLGIDRHRLVRELSNYAVPATQPVPRFVFGFDPSIPETALDRDTARALLGQAGLAAGFDVVLHTRRVVAEAAQLVAEDLAPIGIRAQVKVLPDAEFFDLVGRRQATLWVNRFGCLTGDATEFLNDVVHTFDQERHRGSINYAGFSDPELDQAIDKIAVIEGMDPRRMAIQKLMRAVGDRRLVVPLYEDQDVYALETTLAWQPRSDSTVAAADVSLRR